MLPTPLTAFSPLYMAELAVPDTSEVKAIGGCEPPAEVQAIAVVEAAPPPAQPYGDSEYPKQYQPPPVEADGFVIYMSSTVAVKP